MCDGVVVCGCGADGEGFCGGGGGEVDAEFCVVGVVFVLFHVGEGGCFHF